MSALLEVTMLSFIDYKKSFWFGWKKQLYIEDIFTVVNNLYQNAESHVMAQNLYSKLFDFNIGVWQSEQLLFAVF